MGGSNLDVVVLGGAGHVGLPLSLAFARAGLRGGIFDVNRAMLGRIAASSMPFLKNGADDVLRELLPTGRLVLDDWPDPLSQTDQVVVVVGTPVEEFLAP
jgi:UDP-N-acetyl-D-mannosaminuronic acid dehydrogenase